jgi:twitching motility two-component system response regulator PilH
MGSIERGSLRCGNRQHAGTVARRRDTVGSFNAAWVLVIEDLRDQAELWSDVCAEAGLNATTAANGVQGYQKACSSPPAIILLDVMLPDIDGWEVCRRLKTDERTKHIPIVILTARDEPKGPWRATEAGCAAYVTKPCPPADLVAVIRRVLREQESV